MSDWDQNPGDGEGDKTTDLHRRHFLQVGALATGTVFGSGLGSATASGWWRDPEQFGETPDDNGRIIVSMEDTRGIETQAADIAPAGSTVVTTNESIGFAVIEQTAATTADVESMAQSIEAEPGIRYAHPDYTMTLDRARDLRRFLDGHNRISRLDASSKQYAPEQVNAPDAWQVTEGDGATIAVIDDSFFPDHEAVAPNVHDDKPGLNLAVPEGDGEDEPKTPTEASSEWFEETAAFLESEGFPSIDGPYDIEARYDREWNVDDPSPRSFEGYTTNAGPLIGRMWGLEFHGTSVAGVASGRAVGSNGMNGISNCSLYGIRASGASFSINIDMSNVLDGIANAVDTGADVINMSLGKKLGEDGEIPAGYVEALEYARENGALCVASAGNNGEKLPGYSPASHPLCLAVSAVDANEELTDFSNSGDWVDLTAPGKDVVGPDTMNWTRETHESDGDRADYFGDNEPHTDLYATWSGTSYSAPVVSGVAGLVYSVDPSLGPEDVEEALKETATDIGLDETEQGAGQVDAAAAVNYVKAFEAQTDGAMEIYESSATLTATVLGLDPDEEAVVEFHYRKSGAESYERTDMLTVSANGTVQADITDLEDDTTYECRVFAGVQSGGFDSIATGDWKTFSTEYDVETIAPTSVTDSSATLEGKITGMRDGNGAWAGFEYTTASSDDTEFVDVEVSSPGEVSKPVSDLEAGTAYSYRFMALTAQGTVEGDWQEFRTTE